MRALPEAASVVAIDTEVGMHPLMLEPKERERKRNWAAWRRPESANDRELQDETVAWMARLPEPVRPDGLARSFPRIANQLARIVHDPVQLERYMDSLIVDHRGDRQGFPAPIALELMKLHLHFQARRQYAPARRSADLAPGARAARYAEHELLHSADTPPARTARRPARQRATKKSWWERALCALGIRTD